MKKLLLIAVIFSALSGCSTNSPANEGGYDQSLTYSKQEVQAFNEQQFVSLNKVRKYYEGYCSSHMFMRGFEEGSPQMEKACGLLSLEQVTNYTKQSNVLDWIGCRNSFDISVVYRNCGVMPYPSDVYSPDVDNSYIPIAAATTVASASGAAATLTPFGPGCAAVPADGAGSFAGMAKDPAATAASNNPALSTLVAAVTAAGLGDILNGAGPFTIFAPTNDAFAKIDKATLAELLADPKGDLTKILTFHVIPGKALSAADLLKSGSEATVQGGMVKITGSGQDATINGASKVVCGDVQVGNGIVHIIDTVLMPS